MAQDPPDAPAATGRSSISRYRAGEPARTPEEAEAFREWRQLDAEDHESAREMLDLENAYERYQGPLGWNEWSSLQDDPAELARDQDTALGWEPDPPDAPQPSTWTMRVLASNPPAPAAGTQPADGAPAPVWREVTEPHGSLHLTVLAHDPYSAAHTAAAISRGEAVDQSSRTWPTGTRPIEPDDIVVATAPEDPTTYYMQAMPAGGFEAVRFTEPPQSALDEARLASLLVAYRAAKAARAPQTWQVAVPTINPALRFTVQAADASAAAEIAFEIGNRQGADLDGQTWPRGARDVSVGDVVAVTSAHAVTTHLLVAPVGFEETDPPSSGWAPAPQRPQQQTRPRPPSPGMRPF